MKRTGASDTSPESQRIIDAAYRAMPPARKLRLQHVEYRHARWLHETGLRVRRSDVTRAEIQRDWNAHMLGPGPWSTEQESGALTEPRDNFDVVREVTGALDRLGIAYAIGGSWASSFYGEPRSTHAVDLMAAPFPGKEAAFAGCFGPDYYISVDAVEAAILDRGTFSVVNTFAGYKADVFIQKDREFDASVMRRRALVTQPGDPDHPLIMISPEDTIIQNLEWCHLGGGVSERQWLDVLSILRIQAGRLDPVYLDHWADHLGISDLLDQARKESRTASE